MESVGAASQTTTYGYDAQGNRISEENALNDKTYQAFDALNRLITVTDALTHATSYGYDAQNNLTSVTDPRSLVTNYIYDGFGQVIQETSPDRGTTVYTLDKAGNRTAEIDARNIVTNRTFDALDRVLTQTFPASAGEDIAYSYDSIISGNKGIGQLTGYSDESGSTSLVYDDRGNAITVTQVISGQNYTTEYEYDLSNHITRITYPSGHIIDYDYDNDARIESVDYRSSSWSFATTLADAITYLPFGPMAGLTFDNGLTTTYNFDQDYRMTGLITTDGSADIQNLTFAPNNVDNITSITDHLDNSRNQAFTYDKLYRLTQGVGSYGTIDYTYDNNGNRTTRATGGITQTYSYTSGSNKLASISNSPTTRSFTSAANGNITTDDRSSGSDMIFTYGNRNRNQQASVSGGDTANYLYSANGRRVSKAIVGGAATHFIYDQNNRLIAEHDGTTGAVMREYAWLNDLPVAQIESGPDFYFIHVDQLNTPQKITDASKVIVWDRQQEPFGEDAAITATIANPLRFPGQFADSESGLNYNLMRNYDPTLGRYIEADPIGMAGSSVANMNLYGYANQNALRYTDPTGENPGVLVPIGVGIGTCLRNPSCGAGLMGGTAAIIQAANINRPTRFIMPNGEECDLSPRKICIDWYEDLMRRYHILKYQTPGNSAQQEYNEEAKEYNDRCPPEQGMPYVPYFLYIIERK